MESKSPIISFIIPNWNHKDLLSECIASIYETAGNISHEIIVVDNGSTDGSYEYVKECYPEVILIQNKVNLGFARAINQGVGESKGDYIFLLNNDVRLLEGSAELLVRFLEKGHDAGAVAPALYYPDGRFQVSCRRFPSPVSILLEFFGIEKIGRFRKWKLNIYEHVEGVVMQPMASALLIRRECWEAVGFMDESLPIFFNDVDWCYRFYKNTDFKIYFYPEAKAIHHHGASVSRMRNRKRLEFIRSLVKFQLKHFPVANISLFYLLLLHLFSHVYAWSSCNHYVNSF